VESWVEGQRRLEERRSAIEVSVYVEIGEKRSRVEQPIGLERRIFFGAVGVFGWMGLRIREVEEKIRQVFFRQRKGRVERPCELGGFSECESGRGGGVGHAASHERGEGARQCPGPRKINPIILILVSKTNFPLCLIHLLNNIRVVPRSGSFSPYHYLTLQWDAQ
jgi:hypothetical protein